MSLNNSESSFVEHFNTLETETSIPLKETSHHVSVWFTEFYFARVVTFIGYTDCYWQLWQKLPLPPKPFLRLFLHKLSLICKNQISNTDYKSKRIICFQSYKKNSQNVTRKTFISSKFHFVFSELTTFLFAKMVTFCRRLCFLLRCLTELSAYYITDWIFHADPRNSKKNMQSSININS